MTTATALVSAPTAGDNELPGYEAAPRSPIAPLLSPGATERGPSTEHRYSLETGKGLKWISLVVHSRASNEKNLPLFFDGDEVTGSVEFDLPKAESVKGVIISITAGTTAVGQEEDTFLTISPPSPLVPSGKIGPGKQSFPFSLALPKEVDVSEHANGKGAKSKWPMPPTMSERASPAYIDYKLSVTVKRGAFKVNQTLGTSIHYLPLSHPDPPSAARQEAYHTGAPVPGPDTDPDGWKVLAPVTVKGTLFDTRQVEVTCTLAVGTPLAYAPAQPFPLYLTLSSPDTQLLDLLCAPTSPQIRLVRILTLGHGALKAAADSKAKKSANVFVEPIGSAYWWHAPAPVGDVKVKPEEGVRRLMGELNVRSGLKPSFMFPRYCISYALQFHAFNAPGFVPTASSSTADDEPLLAELVKITTSGAPGVQPKSHAPPGYEPPKSADYNTAVGYLENGNQRFYHHGHAGWAA